MTPILPDPDDPGEAAQLAALAALMQLAEDLVSARDTVVLPVVGPNALGMCAAGPVSSDSPPALAVRARVEDLPVIFW